MSSPHFWLSPLLDSIHRQPQHKIGLYCFRAPCNKSCVNLSSEICIINKGFIKGFLIVLVFNCPCQQSQLTLKATQIQDFFPVIKWRRGRWQAQAVAWWIPGLSILRAKFGNCQAELDGINWWIQNRFPKEEEGIKDQTLASRTTAFCNHCSPSLLQLLSDDAFSLLHSPYQPHYVPFVLCSDFPKEDADFSPSETIGFSYSLYLETSCLSPVLFNFILLKLSCKDIYSTQTALVQCCTSALGKSSWPSHLPLRKTIYEQFYAGQMWNEYSILLLKSTALGMW